MYFLFTNCNFSQKKHIYNTIQMFGANEIFFFKNALQLIKSDRKN